MAPFGHGVRSCACGADTRAPHGCEPDQPAGFADPLGETKVFHDWTRAGWEAAEGAQCAVRRAPVGTRRRAGSNPQVLMLVNGIPATMFFGGDRGLNWGGLPIADVVDVAVPRFVRYLYAQDPAPRVRPSFASLPRRRQSRPFIGASIGISPYPQDGADVATLLKHADMAMHRANKDSSGFQFYEASMEHSMSGHLRLENNLRRALERDEFELFYQPKARVDSGELLGVEALLRWHHPTRGVVLPGTFVPLAEETGLIVAAVEWALRDDFGTVYSSPAYLKRFPVNTVKVDRAFVHEVPDDADDVAIVTGIIALAPAARVIAEGVETDEQLAFLRERGCD
jgi:EAL domain